jgi:hypothetical protein
MPVPAAAEPTFLIWRQRLSRALQAAVRPLAYGLRMWAAVVLALTISFWLELDNAYWAGTSAAITCQPVLGASLRKGWFRMIGTVVGAVAAVVLTACFPQNRAEFLLGLAMWGGVCAFAATILRNFASYGAALAGITAAIVASDQMGEVGGANGDAFMLAITRATEICIGIVSAGIVLAGTDFGRARHQLAATLSGLAAEITGRLIESFHLAPPEQEATRTVRRDLIRRVGALDTIIDQAMGESPAVRFNPRPLQAAMEGLFAVLSGWRIIANHLPLLPGQQAARETAAIRRLLPVALQSVQPEKDAARLPDVTGTVLRPVASSSDGRWRHRAFRRAGLGGFPKFCEKHGPRSAIAMHMTNAPGGSAGVSWAFPEMLGVQRPTGTGIKHVSSSIERRPASIGIICRIDSPDRSRNVQVRGIVAQYVAQGRTICPRMAHDYELIHDDRRRQAGVGHNRRKEG